MSEQTPDHSETTPAVSAERRNLLKGAAAVTALSGLSFLGQAYAEGEEPSHAHHQHTVDQVRMRVVQHAMDCVMKGQMCSEHCIQLFKAGDTSVAECADRVQDMLASCTAMGQLASYNSPHLKDMMPVCISICEDCEKACREHAKEHAECKACADSCADCIKVCKDYLA
jgi:Cys-rich four helix bundle protein (predicted Tat secretion target)